MILKKWEDIPQDLKNDYTLKYYNYLKKKKVSLVFKRIFDILFSILFLIFFSPIFLVIAIWIKIDSRGPIFYRQERITQYGKKFKIFKFRTMVQNADKIGTLVTVNNDKRITRVGNKLRKLRLDEIPQVINILKGELSFVGVRPEVQKYVNRYTDEMKATLLMKAGVTSNTSIYFRNEDAVIDKLKDSVKKIDDIYVEDVLPIKMKYNLEYINSFNIFLDIKICVDTVLSVLGFKKVKEIEIANEEEKNPKEKADISS